MSKHTFLALTNDDLGLSSPIIQGAVYTPGLVCTGCQHPVSLGLVVKEGVRLELLGDSCASIYQPDAWVDAMQSRKYYLDQYDCIQDKKLPSHQRTYFRALALYGQIYPDDDIARIMLLPFRKDEEITQELRWDIDRMVAPIGKLKDVLARRDQITRLSLMTDLGDALGKEQGKINGMLQVARLRGLTSKQNYMVLAIQKELGANLLPFSRKLLAAWPPQHGSITIE